MLGKDYEAQDCALARALEVVGERWTLLIVRDAFYGVRRFKDFEEHLDIPKAVLSDRLASLVENGVLERRPDPGHAGRHLYEMTATGRDLWPVVHALVVWGERHREGASRVFLHAECETPIADDGSCPRCGVVPRPEDLITVRRRGRGSKRAPRQDAVAKVLMDPHRLLDPIET
jgi:DNA-binding HxlR family transcriptional regulator